MSESVMVRRHSELTAAELDALGELFDGEYLSAHGRWDPEAPYGYSPADFHVLVFRGPALAAHVGFQRRVISVAGRDVLVAGTGGVLVDKSARGAGLGRHVMSHATKAMRDEAGVEFGYLGCREEVVPFYESTGWRRVHAMERCLSRLDRTSVIVSEDEPILVCSAVCDREEWPDGDIDLRGTPW